MTPERLDTLAWQKQDGLLPAIVQDADTRRVLMLGYMNRAALQITLDSGRVTFYSRSKGRLWTKGETSGNVLTLVAVEPDCDGDTLLVQARPLGPTCHLGTASCFPESPGDSDAHPAQEPAYPCADYLFLAELDALIARRARERPEGSYTTTLFDAGIRRIAQKVGEEGVETALAAVAQDAAALLGEAADLLYHLAVLLRARDRSLADAIAILRQRHAPSG